MQNREFNRYVPSLVWLAVILVLLLIPLRIIGYGYLPLDDALRHAAKAVSGKEWSEILVLNPAFTLDHNPGWHVLLGGLHSLFGWEADALVIFSVVGLFLAFAMVPLFWLKRPEAWLIALLLVFIANQGIVVRIFLGRPLMLSVTALMALLCLVGKEQGTLRHPRNWIIATLLLTVTTWTHGAWYLFALPVMALALAGRKQDALRLGGCWLGGSVLGALFTGHPVDFLVQAIRIVTTAFGESLPTRILVYEFQPTDGDIKVLFVLGGFALWRIHRGWPAASVLRDPVFILLAVSWVLGLKVARFWYDWGVPAALIWLARGLSEELETRWKAEFTHRLGVTALAAAGLFYATTADLGSRWTHNLNVEHLDAKDPALAGWLPEDGGIIYNDDMAIFYQTFFHNPRANWKYLLGYEPTLMPPEELAILRRMQLLNGVYETYAPWVGKMTLPDRLIMRGAPSQKPGVPGLEWAYAGSNTWIGRKPRPMANPPRQ
jgi:hypothetical protein